ncbi:MAG: serpin family protein [Gemmatimonadaceae bacterium]|nr:serpin family protein [Gemmatimonadaceae bacterium]
MHSAPSPARARGWALAAAAFAFASACSQPMTPPGQVATLDELPRPLSAAERNVRDASNSFAFGLFGRASAAGPGENVFLSPLSVSLSLGMVLNGAAGETQEQMRQALGFGAADLATVQQGYRDLSALLRGLDKSTTFQIANSIWHDRRYPFRTTFLDAGRTYFDSEVRAVDFTDTEGTKRAVNAWVSEMTNGRIPTIVDDVAEDDVMYLVNAIWFKGTWRSRFDAAQTRDAAFTTADGTTQTVRMMNQEVGADAGFRAFSDAQVEAGELAYGNGAFAMTILLPPPGTSVDALAASLTPARWNAIIEGLAPRTGWFVEIPRFTLTYSRELKDDLIALGMRDVFVPSRANLAGMSERGDLYVGFVTHKAFVKVDEEGTEAAAVTNTGIRVTSMPPGFYVNRPFVFAIRERLSGTVLFVGKVARIP